MATMDKAGIVISIIVVVIGVGFAAIKNIRTTDKSSFIIAVTADIRESTEKKLKELNVNHVAYKPVNLDQIIETIENN